MRLLILLSILFIIIFISGCTGTGPLVFTPPKMVEQQHSLNFYGEILDYITQDDLIILKVQPEIINYELNNTALSLDINKSIFKEYKREITDYSQKNINYSEENIGTRMWYSSESYYVYDIEKLEPKIFYYFKLKSYNQDGTSSINDFFGQFLSYNTNTESIEVYSIWNNAEGKGSIYLTNSSKFEWESINGSYISRNSEFLSAQRPWRFSDLVKGNKYVIQLSKLKKEGPWNRIAISENLTKYKEEGSFQHDNDLMRDQRLNIEENEDELQPGQLRTGRIFPEYIIPGGITELKIDLINKQDNDINYIIKDAKIVDENILQPFKSKWEEPPYEERLNNSIIEGCEVKYDSQESTISTNSIKELNFEVTCDNIECRNWYISDTYGNITIDCELILWGQIEFVDELGNKHIMPELGMLRQMLTTGKRANLTVEYSKEIDSKEEFYIYADYRDSEGNAIHNAQIELKITGIEGIFSLRYDDALDKYKFVWSTFYEHAPLFEGTYEFTITAIETGYETKRDGPYTIKII